MSKYTAFANRVQNIRGILWVLSVFCFVIFGVLTSMGTTWISESFFFAGLIFVALPHFTSEDKFK